MFKTPNAYSIKNDFSQPIDAIGEFAVIYKEPQKMEHYHWHGHIEVNWLETGVMSYLFDGQEVDIPKNQLLLFNASIPHRCLHVEGEKGEPARLYNLYFPLDAFLSWTDMEEIQQILLAGGVVTGKKHEVMDYMFIKNWHEDFLSNPEYKKLISLELMARIYRLQLEGWEEKRLLPQSLSKRKKPTKGEISHVARILQFISQNLHQPLTIAEIGKNVGLHPNYAMNLFRKVMHIPLKKYIIRMRLHRAHILLLETDLPIAIISYKAGFHSVGRFYEVFKQEYKIAPNLYRKKY